jgi:hypothetical protein
LDWTGLSALAAEIADHARRLRMWVILSSAALREAALQRAMTFDNRGTVRA